MSTKGKKVRRRLLTIVLTPIFLAVGFVVFCNAWITIAAKDRIFHSATEAPANRVGVVLGTSKNLAPGRPNLHFKNRIQAAAELFKAGKVEHLLVSGSHADYYDEATDMTAALIALGVPEEAITKDKSGFRTLDSIIRAERIFGQDRYTIITDDFHVSRAVFLAMQNGQDVVGYASEHVAVKISAGSRLREVFARCKAVLDIFILDTQPRELGQPSPINVAGTES